MPVLEGTTVSISTAITEVTTILSGVADIITSNMLFMIPIAASFVGIGIGIFKRLKHA